MNRDDKRLRAYFRQFNQNEEDIECAVELFDHGEPIIEIIRYLQTLRKQYLAERRRIAFIMRMKDLEDEI